MVRNARTGADPDPTMAATPHPDPVLDTLANPDALSPEVDEASKSQLTKRAKAVEETQVGEAYVVIYPSGVSLPVQPVSDDKNDKGQYGYPEAVTLGDGRRVAVKDGHVVIPQGTRIAAGSVEELERFRSLASLGFLSAAAS
jgi:hypothetical protein